ncbi:MAG: hypothetical protein GF331_02005 [Chitinivibrionales bacterium]|nr:hypothetical protein [Chitinivibrionales bacterium]
MFSVSRKLAFVPLLFLLCRVGYAQSENEYVLQPGDVIRITVVEHPEFSGQHKIRPDGRINYPVLGELDVASLTPQELVKLMQGKLTAYINNPVVSVSIESYYANRIFIIGAVRKSGQYQIYEPIDALKALAMAGGLQNARARSLKIIRADGRVETIKMREFWGEEGRRDNSRYLLYPGDTMYVPAPFKMPWGVVSIILTVLNTSLLILLNAERLSD